MFRKYKADLHIHTCLSPCAELQMTPSAIIKTAFKKGLDIIAITDHNSADNVIATKKAGEKTGITVLAGMEVASTEEVHILAIFDSIENVMKLQDIVYDNLLPGENDMGQYGDQVVVNENDEVLSFNKRLLIASTTLTVHSIVNIIHSLGGLSIASHVDRDAFGVISQLGFIPKDLQFDALEMSPRINRKEATHSFNSYSSLAWVSSSDAHYLKDIGKRTTNFFMKEPTITEMASAMKNTGGRKVEWE